MVVVVLIPELAHPTRLSMETTNKKINQNLYPASMLQKLLKRRLDEE